MEIDVYAILEGWNAYAKNADTYKLRTKILKGMEQKFTNEISAKEINRHLKINLQHSAIL